MIIDNPQTFVVEAKEGQTQDMIVSQGESAKSRKHQLNTSIYEIRSLPITSNHFL